MASIQDHPVYAVFDRMRATVESKANDYADDNNVYSNFEGAAHLAGITVDQVFMTLIGVKVERLRQLMAGKEPNFEAIDDTRIDLANYAALWQGYAEQEASFLKLGVIVSEAIHRQAGFEDQIGQIHSAKQVVEEHGIGGKTCRCATPPPEPDAPPHQGSLIRTSPRSQ